MRKGRTRSAAVCGLACLHRYVVYHPLIVGTQIIILLPNYIRIYFDILSSLCKYFSNLAIKLSHISAVRSMVLAY